jgi:hypothetical protein
MYEIIVRLFPIGFEVVTSVVMEITIFWDARSSLKVNLRFGEKFRFHLQDRRTSRVIADAACSDAGSLLGILLLIDGAGMTTGYGLAGLGF